MNGCEVFEYSAYALLVILSIGGYFFVRQHVKLKQLLESENSLVDEIFFDSLTNLPNRKSLDIVLNDQINRCQRHKKSFYLAQIKINNTENISQSSSKEDAYKMITEASQKLFDAIRDEDMVGHVSRDNFIIIFNEYLDKANLELIFKRIYDTLHDKINLSIGISQFPEDAQNTELLVECSNKALKEVHEKDNFYFHFYKQ